MRLPKTNAARRRKEHLEKQYNTKPEKPKWHEEIRGGETRWWDIATDNLRISVHRLHGCGWDWFLSCPQIGLKDSALWEYSRGEISPGELKKRALAIVEMRLNAMLSDLADIVCAT